MSMTEFFEPRISADTKAYWDGCREHKLMVQKCKACGRLRIPASYVCQNCLSTETELVELKPEGTLYSFVVMHRAFHPSVQDKVPYIVRPSISARTSGFWQTCLMLTRTS